MRVEEAFVGARAVDSYPFSIGGTTAQARRLKASGVDCLIGYVAPMTTARLAMVLDAGLAFMPVTKAMDYRNGAADELAHLARLAIPIGCSMWCDLEGLDVWNRGKIAAERAKDLALMSKWASDINGAGYLAGLYIGAPQPFTSEELFELPFTRYWWGLGRPIDDKGHYVYPGKGASIRGWCMIQQWHGNPEPDRPGGMLWPPEALDPECPASERTFVDTNAIQRDHKNGLPMWVRA